MRTTHLASVMGSLSSSTRVGVLKAIPKFLALSYRSWIFFHSSSFIALTFRRRTNVPTRIGIMHDTDIEDLPDVHPRLTIPPTVGWRRRHSEQEKVTDIPGTATIWAKTFGCAHNQSDSEYMLGQLQSYGYRLIEEKEKADLWLLNSCTVKGPSEASVMNLVEKGKSMEKKLVVAGCVPQGDKRNIRLRDLSIIGVTQIDRVVEVVEETLKGHVVRLLTKKPLPRLDLPKIRRNAHVEIVPLSTGCLGKCTYCKTKHARGELGSYDSKLLVKRVKDVVSDPLVREIWLSSEDTGAYGRDLGTNIAELLDNVVAVLPRDGRTMLRLGMTNPPFILEHLSSIGRILQHPFVYAYLHVPVQCGSNRILEKMKREYTVPEFEQVCDALLESCPELEVATDIICGFPGETEEDFEGTLSLVKKYKFKHCHISQFYPRPGTPAARMQRVPTKIVKQRSRRLTALIENFPAVYDHLIGTTVTVWVMDKAADGYHLVGHTKTYTQVLLKPEDSLLGSVVKAQVIEAGRWSVKAEVTDWIFTPTTSTEETSNDYPSLDHHPNKRTSHLDISATASDLSMKGDGNLERDVLMGDRLESGWRVCSQWTIVAVLVAVLGTSCTVWLDGLESVRFE